jgi:hypothetical protein
MLVFSPATHADIHKTRCLYTSGQKVYKNSDPKLIKNAKNLIGVSYKYTVLVTMHYGLVLSFGWTKTV